MALPVDFSNLIKENNDALTLKILLVKMVEKRLNRNIDPTK